MILAEDEESCSLERGRVFENLEADHALALLNWTTALRIGRQPMCNLKIIDAGKVRLLRHGHDVSRALKSVDRLILRCEVPDWLSSFDFKLLETKDRSMPTESPCPYSTSALVRLVFMSTHIMIHTLEASAGKISH